MGGALPATAPRAASTLVSALVDNELEILTDDANLHAVSRYFAT